MKNANLSDDRCDSILGMDDGNQADFQESGMDNLARNLGLDIEGYARRLAMENDGRPPIQTINVQDPDMFHDYQNMI